MSEQEQEIRVNDTGTFFELEIVEWDTVTKSYVVVNVSSAIASGSKSVIIKDPNGKVTTIPGTFSTDGTDGLIHFITEVGHLPVKGTYYIQGKVALATWVGSSSIGEFEVYDNLV